MTDRDRIHQLEGKLRMRNRDRRRFDILVYTITGNKAHLQRKADTKEGLAEAVAILRAHDWTIGPKWKPGDKYYYLVRPATNPPYVARNSVKSVHDYGNGLVIVNSNGDIANRECMVMYRRRSDAKKALESL
jgi:hypothetical protein